MVFCNPRGNGCSVLIRCVTILFKVMMRVTDNERAEILKIIEGLTSEQLKDLNDYLHKLIYIE